MLDSFKRWISGDEPGPDWRAIAAWAGEKKWPFKRVREGEGFVIDGSFSGMPWRLEWGPSQRAYIDGRELRLRMELDLPGGMQMLVLNRTLMEILERETFEQFTETIQTQIDGSTPEEMRWLAMFPKAGKLANKAVLSHFGVVASAPTLAVAWLEGPLAAQLERSVSRILAADPPFVMMTMRGRLYLRLGLDDPDVETVSQVAQLFDAAAKQALKVAGGHPEAMGEWPATGTSALHSEIMDEAPSSPKKD